jgi:diketogulonate reductase-like aldo/keto reductase
MHCRDIVDPKGTWTESWMALEKAYFEGRVSSIGFSNINHQIIQELEEISTILPHVIQNWSELSNLDLAVRKWCDRNDIIYQPYASIRNLRFQSLKLRSQTQMISKNYNVTEYDVNLRFFLQTGASIIPRASHYEHLKRNIEIPLSWSLSEDEMKDLGWSLSNEDVIEEL